MTDCSRQETKGPSCCGHCARSFSSRLSLLPEGICGNKVQKRSYCWRDSRYRTNLCEIPGLFHQGMLSVGGDVLTLQQFFKQPLAEQINSGKGIISVEQLKQIFNYIEDIVNVNQRLLESLHDKISGWSDTQTIGDVFLMMVSIFTLVTPCFNCCKIDFVNNPQTPFLRLYTLYSTNFDTANSLSKDLMEKKDSFRAFVEEVQEKPECQGLSFGAYLIMPIQSKLNLLPQFISLLDWWRSFLLVIALLFFSTWPPAPFSPPICAHIQKEFLGTACY